LLVRFLALLQDEAKPLPTAPVGSRRQDAPGGAAHDGGADYIEANAETYGGCCSSLRTPTSTPTRHRIIAEHLAKSFAILAGSGLKVAVLVFFPGELATTPGTLTLLADEHANPAELRARYHGGD
jgi:hypothetical protein